MRIERETFWAKNFGNNYITNNLIIFQKKKKTLILNNIRYKTPHIFDSHIDFILNQFCKQLVLNLHSPHTKSVFF